MYLQGVDVISTTASPRTRLAKAKPILNGVRREREAMESMETGEEEEEDNSAIEIAIAHSPATPPSSEHHYYMNPTREKTPHHMQELQTTGQFPMSGDLPSLDPSLPSPSMGFDMSQVSLVCIYLIVQLF